MAEDQIGFQRIYTVDQKTHEKMVNITHHQGNAHPNHNEIIISHLKEWLSSKRQQITSIAQNAEKREPSCTFVGNVHWYNHYGKQYGGSSRN